MPSPGISSTLDEMDEIKAAISLASAWSEVFSGGGRGGLWVSRLVEESCADSEGAIPAEAAVTGSGPGFGELAVFARDWLRLRRSFSLSSAARASRPSLWAVGGCVIVKASILEDDWDLVSEHPGKGKKTGGQGTLIVVEELAGIAAGGEKIAWVAWVDAKSSTLKVCGGK